MHITEKTHSTPPATATSNSVAHKIANSLFLRVIVPGFIVYDIGCAIKNFTEAKVSLKHSVSHKDPSTFEKVLVSFCSTLLWAAAALTVVGVFSTPIGLTLIGACLLCCLGVVGFSKLSQCFDSPKAAIPKHASAPKKRHHKLLHRSKAPSLPTVHEEDESQIVAKIPMEKPKLRALPNEPIGARKRKVPQSVEGAQISIF